MAATPPASISNAELDAGTIAASATADGDRQPPTPVVTTERVVRSTSPNQQPEAETFDSPELRQLKSLKWKHGRELTAHVQDIALQQGKRALVATSGGSFKKFVCSSETPCPWLINAVCTRPRARKRAEGGDDARPTTTDPDDHNEEDLTARKYWYVSSAHLVHTNCTGMAKPTARQLKDVDVLKNAVQSNAKVSSTMLLEQLKSQARLLCSKSMVYKAKTDLLDAMETQSEDNGHTTSMLTSSMASKMPHGVGMDMLLSTQRLPSYLSRLSALNADVLHAIDRDPVASAHFYRAFVALDPRRFFTETAPLVFGIDSLPTTSTTALGEVHTAAAQLICVGCDGNLGTITFAVALVPEASEEQFVWFIGKLIECGYPLQTANAVFTDGKWPASSACARFGIQRMLQDTRSMINQLEQATIQPQSIPVQTSNQLIASVAYRAIPPLSAEHQAIIWSAQEAETESEFYDAIRKLETPVLDATIPISSTDDHQVLAARGIAFAQQLRALDPQRWALFPHLTRARLYGWQTTRFLATREQGQQGVVAPQYEMRLPCEFFKLVSLTLLNETYQRHEQAVQWEREQRVVTPEAERMMQDEMKLIALYDVAMSAPHLAFVWNPQKAPQIRQRRVDLQMKTCTCGMRLQFGIPCRHILSVLRKVNALGQSFEFFDDCYRVRSFVAVHKNHHVELPLDETISLDGSWLPARHVLPPATTDAASILQLAPGLLDQVDPSRVASSRVSIKKRRIRTKQADQRKRPLYKCRKCNVADGHNSMTCPNKRVG